jgi:hypothetical protein
MATDANWLSIAWPEVYSFRERCKIRHVWLARALRRRGRKKPKAPQEADFHHSVYVILLRSSALKERGVLRLNPRRDPLKPCVYVGMTGLPVDHRFENHRNGHKSARVVEKHGLRLLPELYEHLNPMPFEAAAQMEKDLAEDLRAAGYTVTGGT